MHPVQRWSISQTPREARRDIKHRQDLSERSFAWSTRYGYKRARWRNLWRMEIQDFLIAAVQNITILIKQPKDKMSKSNVQVGQVLRNHRPKGKGYPSISSFLGLSFRKFGSYILSWPEAGIRLVPTVIISSWKTLLGNSPYTVDRGSQKQISRIILGLDLSNV